MILVFLIFSFLFGQIVQQQLCVNQSVDYPTCLCTTEITDFETHLPQNVANCERIGLKDIPDKSQLPNDLNCLYLSHNQITKLKQKTKILSGNGYLEKLSLSYNSIEYISESFFDSLPHLIYLDLSHNNISGFESPETFSSLKRLEILNLSFNFIKQLPNNLLESQISLKKLYLSYNNFGQQILKDANFFYNLRVNKNLTYLELDALELNDLPTKIFDNFTKLNSISIANNYLSNIPNFPNTLTHLDISGLILTELHAKHLNYPALKVLYLNRLKKLTKINKYAFYNLLHLEELSIKDCEKLEEISEYVFGLLQKNMNLSLKKLYLSRNGLKRLNFTYKYLFDHLEIIDLGYNPWDCDCDILWLREYKNVLNGNDSIRCSSPQNLKGQAVLELEDSDVPKCFPEKYDSSAPRIIIPVLLALIIVLSGLIGYLIYYSPRWYVNRTCGPNSPYNTTSVEEE